MRLRHGFAATAIVTSVIVIGHAPARAGESGQSEPAEHVERTSDGATAQVSTASSGGAGPSGPGGQGAGGASPWVSCVRFDMPSTYSGSGAFESFMSENDFGEASRELLATTPEARATATGFTMCDRRDGPGSGAWLNQPGAPVDPTPLLLQQAREQLVVPRPVVASSPPPSATQPLGLPVWFWAENGDPVTATAAVPGVSVTIEAVPVSMTVTIDEPWRPEGRRPSHREVEIACDGLGERYDPGRHGAWDRSSCSHVFDWAGSASATIAVTWDLAWTSNTGGSGTLAAVSRSTTIALQPTELEAVGD